MYFQIFKSKANNQWYWHLKSANHEIIAHGEGYINREDCVHAVNLVMDKTRKTPFYEA